MARHKFSWLHPHILHKQSAVVNDQSHSTHGDHANNAGNIKWSNQTDRCKQQHNKIQIQLTQPMERRSILLQFVRNNNLNLIHYC